VYIAAYNEISSLLKGIIMTPNKQTIPSTKELAAELGSTATIWDEIITALEKEYGPLDREWKPSKESFGRICLLKQKKRTLLYMTPEKEKIIIAIVLGERAAALALAGGLPEEIKNMIREARPYAEGRGIRFPVSSPAKIPVVLELVAIKTTPK
jgi:hypothetical protein